MTDHQRLELSAPARARAAAQPKDATSEAKASLRARLLAARRARTAEARSAAADALAERALRLVDEIGAGTVAAYVSFGTEPGTGPLLAALARRDVPVLLPVVRSDLDLDWVAYDEHAPQAEVLRGAPEPPGERLGPDALATAGLVLVPALAVDRHGVRLGRGAGCYDRALTRVAETSPVAALVYDTEVLDDLPRAAYDRLVDAAVTPTRVLRLSR